MLFNSYIFILLFLPIVINIYFLLNRMRKYELANCWLICMSLWFYSYFNYNYIVIILLSISINYIVSRMMYIEYVGRNKYIKRGILAVGILANICSIFYFKYYDFFISNINIIFDQTFELKNVLLPLGISFFTFQQISYLVDSYNGETKDYRFVEYALFVSYFPQLVAGPIVLHSEIIPQFRDKELRKLNHNNLAKGLYIFAVGLFKKVLVADTFARAVDWGFSSYINISSMDAFLVSLCYTFQLYFDFSGYCDMAAGIGNMFNIQLPINFNSPYKSISITDFWSRWHISLTRFLKQYVYIPLGGNRKGNVRTYTNIMIVYLVSGIWHGANWTFIMWGGIHGVANCLNRIFKSTWERIGNITQWFLTFMFIDFTWIIFRAESISQAKYIIKKIVSMDTLYVSSGLFECFEMPEFAFMEESFSLLSYFTNRINGFYMWLILAIVFFVILNKKNSLEIKFKPTVGRGIVTVVFTLWSILSLSGMSTFLYFNF